jgi:hypothetical protein
MAEMFGAPAGVIASNTEFRQDLGTSINAAHTLGEIAMQPSTQRLREAQAGKAEMELAGERKMMELMQRAAGTAQASGSLAGQLESLAQTAAQAGLVTKAGTLAAQASLIRQRENTARAAGAKMNETQLDIIRKNADLQGQIFGGVTDETSWNRANQLFQFQTGTQSPFAGMPYSPDLIKSISEQAISAKERADLLQKQQTATELKNFRRRRLGQHDTALEIQDRRLELMEEREKRLRKQGGGKSVSSPAKAELDQAGRLITKDFPNLPAEDRVDAAYSIAAEARALRRQNPALDANAALQQAFQAARAAGDFQTIPGLTVPLLGMDVPGTGKTGYSGRGKTATVPIPFVKGLKPVKDRFYVNDAGVLGRWNGSKMVLSEMPEVEDEEDEEE